MRSNEDREFIFEQLKSKNYVYHEKSEVRFDPTFLHNVKIAECCQLKTDREN